MADLAREDGVEPERRATGPEPSQGAVGRERATCDHVVDGAPVAGFTSVQVYAAEKAGPVTVLVDLCAECLGLARQSLFVGVDHDRRRERRPTRPPSSAFADQFGSNITLRASSEDRDRRWVTHRNGGCPRCSQASGGHALCDEGRLLFEASTFYPGESWDEHRLSEHDRLLHADPNELAE